MRVTSALLVAGSLVLLGACGEPSGGGGSSSESSTTTTTTTSTTTSTSTSTTTSTSTSTVTTDPDTGSGGTSGGFELDVHTELVGGVLALRCNLPRAIEDCMAIDDGAPCDDVDADGLTDLWEDLALDRLRPMRRLDEAESLIDDAGVILGDVGRVFAVADHTRVFMMLGYSRDYGSCGVSAHNGDSEHVALDLVQWADGGAGGVQVTAAYTAAHEGTATDQSQVFPTDALDQLVFDADPTFGEPRWVVFSSRDKHATYATLEICENISAIPCLDEDCGPEGVRDPTLFDRLPDFVNAGEPEMPRVTSLDELGFVGDDAWADQDFCGGQERTGCTAPVHEKLTIDPF